MYEEQTDHDSSSGSDEGEVQRDNISRPKHRKLLNKEDFNKVKDFDPVRNKIDRMILDYVVSEKKQMRSKLYDSFLSKI